MDNILEGFVVLTIVVAWVAFRTIRSRKVDHAMDELNNPTSFVSTIPRLLSKDDAFKRDVIYDVKRRSKAAPPK